MALLDIFKKKKKPEEEVEKEIELEAKPVKKPKIIKKPTEAKVEKPSRVEPPKVKKEVKIGEAWKILKPSHITEKATTLAKKNQYTFKVLPKANKVEIKKIIEDLYGVDVVSVKIIKVPEKQRRLGKIKGWRKGYKKAIVKIKEGQKIEVLPR